MTELSTFLPNNNLRRTADSWAQQVICVNYSGICRSRAGIPPETFRSYTAPGRPGSSSTCLSRTSICTSSAGHFQNVSTKDSSALTGSLLPLICDYISYSLLQRLSNDVQFVDMRHKSSGKRVSTCLLSAKLQPF